MPVRRPGIQKAKNQANPSTPTSRRNIETISKMEAAALRDRTWAERIGDGISRIAGRLWFVLVHVAWFAGWAIVNSGVLPAMRPFDPYPYPFLTFVVSLEAIFLSLFVLMSQNRASRQADRRAHLDLQINLLAEEEMTKVLKMLHALCAAQGLKIASDPEIRELEQETRPEKVLREIKAKMPAEG